MNEFYGVTYEVILKIFNEAVWNKVLKWSCLKITFIENLLNTTHYVDYSASISLFNLPWNIMMYNVCHSEHTNIHNVLGKIK